MLDPSPQLHDKYNQPRNPRVWLIEAYRAGEQTQVAALAQALGWPFEIKRLSYRYAMILPHVLCLRSRRGLHACCAQQLSPPWPDLIITAGVRNEPIARWIRQQSGERTRIVHVGRPWAHPRHFDLVITTPQYHVPQHPNVLRNQLTLHNIDAHFLQVQRQRWAKKFQHFPRPYIAVMIGGNSGPYTLGPKAANRLAVLANAMATQQSGTLLLSTSARTPKPIAQYLAQKISATHYFYHWQANDTSDPYYAYLALADTFIVTADSVSMLSEAYATGKPLYLFDIGSGIYAMRQPTTTTYHDNDFRITAMLYRALMRWGPRCLSRDITRVHHQLIATKHAAWLNDYPISNHTEHYTNHDLKQAVHHIQYWFTS